MEEGNSEGEFGVRNKEAVTAIGLSPPSSVGGRSCSLLSCEGVEDLCGMTLAVMARSIWDGI
jgi:hypothetical protein